MEAQPSGPCNSRSTITRSRSKKNDHDRTAKCRNQAISVIQDPRKLRPKNAREIHMNEHVKYR